MYQHRWVMLNQSMIGNIRKFQKVHPWGWSHIIAKSGLKSHYWNKNYGRWLRCVRVWGWQQQRQDDDDDCDIDNRIRMMMMTARVWWWWYDKRMMMIIRLENYQVQVSINISVNIIDLIYKPISSKESII